MKNAENTIKNNLDRMIKKTIITETEKQNILSRIYFYTQLGECVKNSDIVIEAETESKNSVKQNTKQSTIFHTCQTDFLL